jgi:Ca2+-binding EF-hand superfamily protein
MEMRKVFMVFDENDDGKLSHANLSKCALEILNDDDDLPSSEEIRTMIEMGDYK